MAVESPTLNRTQVCRLLQISPSTLRRWEARGWVPKLCRYDPADLALLRLLCRLSAARIRARRIQLILDTIRRQLASNAAPWRELRVIIDGSRVILQGEGQKLEPESGQLVLDFDSASLARLLSFPSKSAPPPRESGSESAVWFERAAELEKAGAPLAEVIKCYELSVRADPAASGSLLNLGTIYFHLQDWERAEHYYRRALDVDPDYALAHFNLANLLEEKGDRAGALYHYLKAIRLDPGFADAHYNLALLYQTAGQPMRAIRHWKTYLKLDPASPWAAKAMVELQKLKRATLVPGRGPARPA